jgi:hypothetical protein
MKGHLRPRIFGASVAKTHTMLCPWLVALLQCLRERSLLRVAQQLALRIDAL